MRGYPLVGYPVVAAMMGTVTLPVQKVSRRFRLNRERPDARIKRALDWYGLYLMRPANVRRLGPPPDAEFGGVRWAVGYARWRAMEDYFTGERILVAWWRVLELPPRATFGRDDLERAMQSYRFPLVLPVGL